MLPGEHETRRTLRRKYAADFQFARDVLVIAYQVHENLCRDEPRRFGRLGKAVCVAALTKLCNQYRSIHALCELGLMQDAGIILRAMFEAVLRVEFILCRRPPVLESSAPNHRLTVNFRAKLYVAEDALQLDKYARMLLANPALRSHGVELKGKCDQRLAHADILVGQDWLQWLNRRGRGTMFGLTVGAMADKLGYKDGYDAVYRFESRATHASDLEQFLDNEQQGVITPTLYPDTETTTLPIRMASDFLLAAIELASERFRLSCGQRIAELRGILGYNAV